MIIPIRCTTCGKPIGHQWEQFRQLTKKGTSPRTALDKLKLERYCCRSVFLTHIDMIEEVGKFKR